jgi:Luciferase-like monooxygenase
MHCAIGYTRPVTGVGWRVEPDGLYDTLVARRSTPGWLGPARRRCRPRCCKLSAMSSATEGSRERRPQRGLFLAPFDELFDPHVLVGLATAAEARGWDGVFLWDHIVHRAPVRAVADPWVALGAIAARTERLRLGPMVTPLSRRRVHKLARETVTLDHLSRGRFTLGVGLGSHSTGELEPFGEVSDPRERARLLDEGLRRLAEYWGGALEPRPVQQPRIPVWVAGRWPRRRPLARALEWDGFFPIELPGPDALAELAGEITGRRGADAGPFDLVVEIGPGEDAGPWAHAGATWVLTGFGREPRLGEVQQAIDAGPG